jgi:hypothetical protein
MVRQEERLAVIAHAHLVGILLAGDFAAPKPLPISTPLTALIDISARRYPGRAWRRSARPARRHALGDDFDDRADRGAGFADAVEIALPDGNAVLASGQKNGLLVDLVPVPVVRGRSCAGRSAPARRARSCRARPCGRCRRRRHARRRLARRRAPAAAIVADAVFHVIGEVGMARPVLPCDLAVVLGAGRCSRSASRSACRS